MSFLDQLKGAGQSQRRREVEQLLSLLRENEAEDARRFPEDAKRWKPFLTFLEETLEGCALGEEPVDAALRFFVTEDRMHAYACILPPLDGGADIRIDYFGRELSRSGICEGIDQELPLEYLAQKKYLHIFPFAKGTPPQNGTDGKLVELFPPRPVYVIEERQGNTADFSTLRPVRLVRRGDTISRLTPATPGQEGVDVMGNRFPCRDGAAPQMTIGHNLALSEDGTSLVAMENGAVFSKDGVTFVQTAVVRTTTVTQDDKLVWIAYIDGDIAEGVKITCTNGLLVMGEIRGAEIHAKGSVRAQRGIRKGAKIEAMGQVLAPVIESSTVRAGKEVFAEKILDSEITSESTVYVMGGKGRVQGSTIRAKDALECLRLEGNDEIFLGFSQELTEEIQRLSESLEAAQATLALLRTNVMKLRGTGTVLSPDNRALLDQLVEQRDLYEGQVAELGSQLQQAKEKRRSERDSYVLCHELAPLVTVHIGDRSGQFAYPENRCRIHLFASQVVADHF